MIYDLTERQPLVIRATIGFVEIMTMTPQKPRQAGPWSIPNLLTYARILVVPLVVLCFDLEERGKSTDAARWWALGLFAVSYTHLTLPTKA